MYNLVVSHLNYKIIVNIRLYSYKVAQTQHV